jgi:hypothetical protein
MCCESGARRPRERKELIVELRGDAAEMESLASRASWTRSKRGKLYRANALEALQDDRSQRRQPTRKRDTTLVAVATKNQSASLETLGARRRTADAPIVDFHKAGAALKKKGRGTRALHPSATEIQGDLPPQEPHDEQLPPAAKAQKPTWNLPSSCSASPHRKRKRSTSPDKSSPRARSSSI